MRKQQTRWLKVAAISAAGILALPAVVSGEDGEPADAPDVAVAADVIDQDASVVLDVLQTARSNSGRNLQLIRTRQVNDTIQDALADANGGDATATPGDRRDDVADALGGDGGTAEATNDATADNFDGGENSLTTGAAEATNSLTGSVTQEQTHAGDNTASVAGSSLALAGSVVTQTASAEIIVTQDADANSGENVQVVSTGQANVTDQIATGSANGGEATATGGGEAIATGGAGGDATAGNTSSSSNEAAGGNSVSTGDASASNSSTVTVSQSSSSSTSNSSTVIVAPPEAP